MNQPMLLWGTCPTGGPFYAGRVHAVWPGQVWRTACGSPVVHIWPDRPRHPDLRLCPECCLAVIHYWFPTVDPTNQRGWLA